MQVARRLGVGEGFNAIAARLRLRIEALEGGGLASFSATLRLAPLRNASTHSNAHSQLREPPKPSDPPRQYVPVGNHRVAITDVGPRQSPRVVVCLHGCPGTVYDYRYIGAILEQNSRVIRFDLPGHGETSRETVKSPDPGEQVRVVMATLAQLGLDRTSFFVVGHSVGTQVGPLMPCSKWKVSCRVKCQCCCGLRAGVTGIRKTVRSNRCSCLPSLSVLLPLLSHVPRAAGPA